MRIQLRPQRISDAKRFFEILSNAGFTYFPAKPCSIEEERAFLRQNSRKRKEKSEYNFSILYNGILVGATGARIEKTRPYIAEAGYFIGEAYWRRGIATAALKQLEAFVLENTDVHRIEIRMATDNRVSERVALKCGFKKEGTMLKSLRVSNSWCDCYLYAKIFE